MSHKDCFHINTSFQPRDLPVLLSFAPVCDVVSPDLRKKPRVSSRNRVRRAVSGPRPSAGLSCVSYHWP